MFTSKTYVVCTVRGYAILYGALMKIYRGTDGDNYPVEMKCKKFGYPYKTICGETMYNNTHFLTKHEAWESILKSVNARVSLAGMAIEKTESELKNAQKHAGEAAKHYVTVHRKYNRWINAQG